MRVPMILGLVGLFTSGIECASVGTPEIRDVRARIAGIDAEGVNLVIELDVYNPYTIALRTPEFRYTVDVEDTPLIQARTNVKVDLPPRQVGTVELPARLEYVQLLRVSHAVADADEVDYRLHGVIRFEVMGESVELPFQQRGTVPVFRMPKFALPTVAFSEVTFTSARLVLETKVTNPNAFRLGLGRIRFELSLGDLPVGNVEVSGKALAPHSNGKLTLSGQVATGSALLQLAADQRLGAPKIDWAGTIDTPYGPIPLRK